MLKELRETLAEMESRGTIVFRGDEAAREGSRGRLIVMAEEMAVEDFPIPFSLLQCAAAMSVGE